MATVKGVAPNNKMETSTAFLWQHRLQEDAGSRLNQNLLDHPWSAPNPRAEAEPWRGKKKTIDDEEERPLSVKKDPTSVGDMVDSDPKLLIVEEASFPWNRKSRKSGKEKKTCDV